MLTSAAAEGVGTLFTDNRDIVNFNALSPDQLIAVQSGEYLYDALAGDDLVTLPTDVAAANAIGFNSNIWFSGGDGSDAIFGGSQNNWLDGGLGDDFLDGDAGSLDRARFGGLQSFYTFDYAGDKTQVTALSSTFYADGIDGNDVYKNIEYGSFGDGWAPLVKWHFVVNREQDGVADIEFYENGQLLFKTQTDPKKWNDCGYDDATPIPSGEYAAIYRINGGPSRTDARIEFADENGVSTVPGRTNIQIHSGNTSGDSEGCVVASPRVFFDAVREHMDSVLQVPEEGIDCATQTKAGLEFYDLPVPITVEIRGDVEQPTVSFSEDLRVSEGRERQTSVQLMLTGDGPKPGLTKELDVYFQVIGTATYGEDFLFGSNVRNVSPDRWYVTLEAGKEFVDVPIRILKDKPGSGPELDETILLTIDDIQIWRDPNSTPKADWTLHADSRSSMGYLSSTESLLLGDGTVLVTIIGDVGAEGVGG